MSSIRAINTPSCTNKVRIIIINIIRNSSTSEGAGFKTMNKNK